MSAVKDRRAKQIEQHGGPRSGPACTALRRAVADVEAAAIRWNLDPTPALSGLRQVGHVAIDSDFRGNCGSSALDAITAWRNHAVDHLARTRLAAEADRERGRR